MPTCVIKGCRNYTGKVKKCHGISYHRFPDDPIRSEIWSRIVRKQRKEPYFKPHKNARICSSHFLEKDFDISKSGLRKLKGRAIPQLKVEVFTKEIQRREELPAVDCEREEHHPQPNVDQPQPNVDEAQCSQMEEIDVDISDLDSIFDTPRKVSLKKRIAKLEKRQTVSSKKIKALQKDNARLKKKNRSLLEIVNDLKRKNYINEQMKSILEENAETLWNLVK